MVNCRNSSQIPIKKGIKINTHDSEILRFGILRAILSQEAKDPGIVLELHDLEEILGVPRNELNNQVEILSYLGAINPRTTVDRGASPMILGKGRLLHEELSKKFSNSGENVGSDEFNYSENYRYVEWDGASFTFSESQAVCVGFLHRSHLEGSIWVSSGQINRVLEKHGIYSGKMGSIFRGHDAWGSLIVYDRSRPGLYKLNITA